MNTRFIFILILGVWSNLFSTSQKIYVCEFDTKPDAATVENLRPCCEGPKVKGQADKEAEMPTCKSLKGSMWALKSCCEKNKGHAHRYSVKESE